MRALQRLVRNSNSTAVSIPKVMLIHLGWFVGEFVVIELLEDNTLRLRRPCEQDIAPLGAPRIIHDGPAPKTP